MKRNGWDKCDYTVEVHHFELSWEMKNRSKKQEFEITDSKRLKGKTKANGFEFKISVNLEKLARSN